MKRKKAMAFNATGGTIEYIGASAQNLIKNGCYPAGVSCNCGVNVYGGYDYSYASCDGRCYSRAFRKVFNPVDFDILQEKNLIDDVFVIGRMTHSDTVNPVIFFCGWRVVIEYFDVNAVADFTGKIDDNAPTCDEAMQRFCDVYSGFDTRVVNEHLINVFAK